MKDLISTKTTVCRNAALNALEVKLSGFLRLEELEAAFDHEYQMIDYYKLDKCIVDLREIEVYPQGGKELVQDKWFPTVEKLGVKYIAFVQPESAFGESSMRAAHQNAQMRGSILVKHFKNKENALAWLNESPETVMA